jgi:PAS domain S-box-containing protein
VSRDEMDTHDDQQAPTDLFAGLYENAPDAIVVVDAKGIVRLANRQTEVLFGYTRAELLGRSVDVLVPERVLARHPDLRSAYFHDPETRPMGAGLELTARRKDGSEFAVDISLSPLQTPEGMLVSAAVRDITERKRAEAKFQGLLESAPDAIVVVDADGIVRLANRQTEAMFGYRREALIGRPVEMLLPERIAPVHPKFRSRYFNEPLTRPMGAGLELTARRSDGSEFPVDISLAPLETEEGTLVSAAVRDITEQRRRAAEILGQSEERFRLLVEGVQDYAIITLDSEGRIATWNLGAQRIHGVTANEALGQDVSVLYGEEDIAEGKPQYELEVARESGRFEDEGWRVRSDGSRFWANVVVTALRDDDGALRGFSRVSRDITERKRAGEERELLQIRLNQAQRLESLGQLAGGVAHDFNNLLAAVMNYAWLIHEDPSDPEAVRADVAQIRRAAERAATLTHQLLIFGRREVVKPEVLDLNAVVAEIEALLRRTIGEHIELRTKLEPNLNRIKADPSGVEQVLMNLVVNARDAMHAGGTLVIETKNAEVSDITLRSSLRVEPGRYVVLAVADSGTGMTAEVAGRAFEPFFTTKERGKGSGLGLATVYGIVTQAGGDVNIYSEPGMGTTIRAYFPVTDEAPEVRPHDPVVQEYDGTGRTILLVEDEEQVREPTRRTLVRRGYEVLTARDGSEALQRVESHANTIDLLLTDVVMPGMSGKELAERVAAMRPAIKVLFMSGYSQEVIERGASSEGMQLLEKPFNSNDLLRHVRDMIEGGTETPDG